MGGGDENMRVTKVVLGLAGLLLISLVFVSFQAAAHPSQSENDGKAPVDPNFEGLFNGWTNSGGKNGNGFAQ